MLQKAFTRLATKMLVNSVLTHDVAMRLYCTYRNKLLGTASIINYYLTASMISTVTIFYLK